MNIEKILEMASRNRLVAKIHVKCLCNIRDTNGCNYWEKNTFSDDRCCEV